MSHPKLTDGGTIAFVRDGDRIVLDIDKGVIDLAVDERQRGWNPLPPRHTRGVLAKYTRLVGSASTGVICG